MTTHQPAAIQNAILFHIGREGALSASEIAAYYPGMTPARVTTQIKKLVASGQLVALGTSNTGARCYGNAVTETHQEVI